MKLILFVVNVCILLISYSCLLNQYVGPNATNFFQLVALGLPILIIINLLLLIAWLFIKPVLGLLFLVLSVFLIIPANRIYHFYGSDDVASSNFKVMSYNVHYFYDDREGIKNLFTQESPDLIMLQEIGTDTEAILPDDETYYTSDFTSLGIASKYPIIEINKIDGGERRIRSSYADIKIKKDTIRAINVYLESFHIEKEFVKETMSSEKIQENSKTLYQKLVRAFVIHQKEVNVIKKFIENSPYPVILGGDFNSVPNSYEYFKLKNGLIDTFVAGGTGLGTTFHNFKFPIKIDHIFISPSMKTHSFRVVRKDYSDHFPVIAEILL